MKLKCHKIQRHLSDYIDETLSEQQAADLALHLRACTLCRREAAALKKTCNLIENFYVAPDAPDAYYTRFTAELQRRIEHMPPTAIHQQLRAVSTRLGWQLSTLLYRCFDRFLPIGHLLIRQREALSPHTVRGDQHRFAASSRHALHGSLPRGNGRYELVTCRGASAAL